MAGIPTNGLSINISSCNRQKGGHFNLGVRNVYIFHYVVSGKGRFFYDGIWHEVKKGQCFLICPYFATEYYPDKSDPWEYIWINFEGESAEKLLNFCDFSSSMPVTPEMPTLQPYFEEIYKNNKLLNFENYCTIYKNFLQIFNTIAKVIPAPIGNTHEDIVLEPAIKYIITHLHESDLSVDTICKALNINRTTLYRKFVKKINCPPVKFIYFRRMEEAVKLLISTTLSIKAVANSVGYANQMYFSKAFSDFYGCSPKEYRKKNSR